MIKRELAVRVVAAVMLSGAVVWLSDSGSWSWALLALLAALAGANLGRSSVDSTAKLVTPRWWVQGKRPILALAFAAGLAVSGFLVGSVVFILGELQVTLRTFDRVVFGFLLVFAMLFIDSDRLQTPEPTSPQVDKRTEADMTQQNQFAVPSVSALSWDLAARLSGIRLRRMSLW